MLLGRLGASLLGNISAGKGAIAKSVSEQTKSKKQGQGIVRADCGNKKSRKTTTKKKMDF